MLTTNELNDFLASVFPQSNCVVEYTDQAIIRVRQPIGESDLRPGGTVSGPTMMKVADVALYVAVLNAKGLIPLAVTTNLSINFLNKPSADKDLIAECKLLKMGRTLVIGEVSIFSKGSNIPVAHATGTYSIPPVKN
ncbi:MAG: thioesterase [Gammaproteobacteria bacterium]|nr:MAG: thioesterase [Gammaproteobacteria bacterium]PHR85054.1 MAG: thioesterase [Colwellia sp.]